MNRWIWTGALLLAAATAGAGYPEHRAHYDQAEVTAVDPILTSVRVEHPRRECWEEEVVYEEPGYHSKTPLILGGIVGGALGSQVGKGRGRDAATIAGLVLGASVGNDLGRSRSPALRHVVREPVCRDVVEYIDEERVVGYRVQYRYQGRTYETRMDHDPGPYLRVRVDVEPAL